MKREVGQSKQTSPDGAVATQPQYSLLQILGIWAAVTVPMGILRFIVTPLAMRHLPPSFHPGIFFWLMMIAGMMWQFALALVILHKEVRPFTWENLKIRLWLGKPRDPQSGRRRPLLLLWVIPVIVYSFAVRETGILSFLSDGLVRLFPALRSPEYTDIAKLADPQFVGAWWIIGVALMSSVFNYLLGEELLFRGILLPRMNGRFGRFDWLANGVLFALYHVHKVTTIPVLLVSSLFIALPSKVFRSNWMSVIIHGVEGLIVLFLVLGVVTGALV